MRLHKYLAMCGVCSRRAGEALIQEGRVQVNGETVARLGMQVRPGVDRVSVDGRPVSGGESKVYIVLNKPRGYVTSCDHPGERIVLELVDLPQRIFPVGRLDKDSTGLLLLTNDGPIHHRLSHPSFDHEKEYEVTVDAPLSDSDLEQLARGMPLDGRMTRPAGVERIGARRFRITLMEGRNRQIRRMVGGVGRRVVALHRVRVGNIRLGRLREGQWRYLTEPERLELIKSATE